MPAFVKISAAFGPATPIDTSFSLMSSISTLSMMMYFCRTAVTFGACSRSVVASKIFAAIVGSQIALIVSLRREDECVYPVARRQGRGCCW